MKLYAVLAGVALAALVAAVAAHLWIIGTYAPGLGIVGLFLDATPVVKLVMMLCILAIVGVVILLLIGLASRSGGGEVELLLALMGAGAILFGVLGAAYGEMNIQAGIRAVGRVSFEVTAPSRAEWLLCLSLGLFAGVLGLGGAAMLAGRRRRREGSAEAG